MELQKSVRTQALLSCGSAFHQGSGDRTCRIVQEGFVSQVWTFPAVLLPSSYWPDCVR